MRKQNEILKNKNYSFYPSELSTVLIDGEYVLLGPVIYALMQERGVKQQTVLNMTSCDRRTFRDFLHGKQTHRLRMGIAVTSQIMRTADITVTDIVTKARQMKSLGTLPCIKPPDVASSEHDGRMEERKTHDP